MDFIKNIKTLGQNIIDLVFPVSCLICGKEKNFLCTNCAGKLPQQEKQKCIVCATPSPFGKTHPDCHSKNTVDGLLSALPYSHPHVKKIIEVFKYNFVSELASPLASLIIKELTRQNLSDYFKDFVIVPVPLHKRRFNWRGFNQAELLAKTLSQHLGAKVEDALVLRIRYTRPQVGLSLVERKSNIKDAFSLSASELSGKKFLLIDDVITSGTTLNEIAIMLKKANAAEVWAATVAHG